MSDTSNILDILARVDAMPSDAPIPGDAYATMVTYGSVDRVIVGRIAYAIRTRTVAGVAGDTLTAYAMATDLRRTSLAQWASAVGYLVDSKTTVTPDTFALALKAYNSGAEGRKIVREAIPNIAGLSTDAKRVAQWRKTVAAVKRTAVAPATVGTATDTPDAPATTTVEADTRTAQVPDGGDIGARTIAFVAALGALASQVGAGDETYIAPTNAQAREIENYLAVIASHVTAYVSA